MGRIMAKEATAIRFSPEEKRWIQSYAALQGSTFSEVVREAILEKVEDMIDAQAYEAALEEDEGVRYTMDEVMEMCERMP